MGDLDRQKSRLKEVLQFGGEKYEDKVKGLRTGEWIPFNRAGNLLVQEVPCLLEWGYEIARISAEGEATFPDPPSDEYRTPAVDQTVYVFAGTVIATLEGVQQLVRPGTPLFVPKGTWTHLYYRDAQLQFHCTPTLAGEDLIEFR